MHFTFLGVVKRENIIHKKSKFVILFFLFNIQFIVN